MVEVMGKDFEQKEKEKIKVWKIHTSNNDGEKMG